MDRMQVVISTDGACSGNPGPGGYAGILRFGPHTKTVVGYEDRTTNNRMELKAVIEAVRILKKPCVVTVQTDSQYICNGIANAKEREENGWRTKTGARCANFEMWQELAALKRAGKHKFQYLYVKGHSGHPDNEECDRLAKEQIALNRRA